VTCLVFRVWRDFFARIADYCYFSFIHHKYEWAMSNEWTRHLRVWMSRITNMNESCRTDDWVMSHMWMSHVTHANQSCRAYEWVLSHVWMSHVTNTNDLYEWVTPHMNCRWLMSQIWFSLIAHKISRVSRMNAPWHTWIADGCKCARIRVTWLIYTSDMARSYAWHDVLIRIQITESECAHVRHGFTCVTWLRMCESAWHDSYTRMIWLT